jgi:hypothetical protein
MPLLPRKNSLDFNPDATIAASKKLTSITLERMKNPLEDPDFATLSTLNAQRSLGDSVDRLEGLAGRYHSLVLRLGNLLTVDERQVALQREMAEDAEMLGFGRKGKKKGGANDRPYDLRFVRGFPSSSSSSSSATPRDINPQERDINPQELLRILAAQMSERMRADADDYSSSAGSTIDPREYNRRLAADRGRFRQFYDDDSRNSSATPASSGNYPYDDPNEPYVDDDDNSTLPTRYSGEPRIGRQMPDAISERVGANFNSLIFPLIQLTREMNMILNSKIKTAITGLTSAQIQKLNNIYQMVRTSYNDVIFPSGRRARLQDPFTGVRNVNVVGIPANRRREDDFEEAIIEKNQFGDEILGTWNEERKNLLLNLTIVVNSWKQNTPTGQQSEFAGDITASYQNTANRLGKKAELVEAMGEMPESWREKGFTYEDLQDLESVGREGDYRAYQDDASVDDPSVYQGFTGLRQYDRQGKIIPYPVGAGRKPRGRPRKTGAMTLIGNGRNFYGDQINHSRDLPTIFSGALRNCPTKYLL